MVARLFSLDEANRLLPLVRAVTEDAVNAYAGAKQAIRELDLLRKRTEAGWAEQEALDRQENRIARRLKRLRQLLDELDELGVRLRDYERGVVDFPAAAADRRGPVVYCWTVGEIEVTHWHAEGDCRSDGRVKVGT